jgi:hypothetical protein
MGDHQTVRLGAGGTAVGPRGVPHTFRCLSPAGRLQVLLIPAGFEQFFEELDRMTPPQQQNIPAVIELGAKYGLEFLPPR